MTPKQRQFIDEYLIDLNATQAAIRAGYSVRTADAIGHENLKKPEIAEAIGRRRADLQRRTEITQERVLLEIARLAFNDPRKAFDESGKLLPVHEWPDEVAAAISSIKTRRIVEDDAPIEVAEIKFWDKGKQLELAGRTLGLFTDKLEHTGKDGAPLNEITVNLVKPDVRPGA